MAMTPEQEAADRAQRLRRVESAAAAAIYGGISEDEIYERVKAGIEEMLANPVVIARKQREAAGQ